MVLSLPRCSYVVTRSRPYLLHLIHSVLHSALYAVLNSVLRAYGPPPCPRVTMPTCPLLTLSLRLCFRFRDQRKNPGGHDDESDITDPLGQAEEFREAEFTVGADG